MDLFNKPKLDLNNITCHSGGALGSDTSFELIGEEFGIKTKAYSYKTKYHTSTNKVEISDDDFNDGVKEIHKANKILSRYGISKYINLLARNWAQVKYSDELFAIGYIVKSGERGSKGFYNKSKLDVVDGGTSYSVQMSINYTKPVYVFDQNKDKWFRWSYISLSFVELLESPSISYQNFAGVGTREIKPNGILAIKKLYEKTFLCL
jgi:hypothetical protein